ncbi:MAG: hypothetical protein AAFO06_19765 [Cyanobacteria bacterium J06597_16]
MGISLSLYDFFAHLVPGGVFLAAFLYAFAEAWLRSPEFSQLSTLPLMGIALISYVLGYVVDPIGNRWYRFFRRNIPLYGISAQAAKDLCQLYPGIRIDVQAMGWYVLLAYIKRRNLPMAQEIEQLNVTHIMLRGLSLGLLLFSVVFCGKAMVGTRTLPYILLSLLSMGMSYVLIQEAIKFRIWFYKSIYQSTLALTLKPGQLPVTYSS